MGVPLKKDMRGPVMGTFFSVGRLVPKHSDLSNNFLKKNIAYSYFMPALSEKPAHFLSALIAVQLLFCVICRTFTSWIFGQGQERALGI